MARWLKRAERQVFFVDLARQWRGETNLNESQLEELPLYTSLVNRSGERERQKGEERECE